MHVHAEYGAQRFVVERPRHHVIGDDAALMHNDNAVRIGRGEVQVMQNDKGPELRRKQLAHRRQHIDLVLDIQIGNRLIKEQEFRLIRLAGFELAHHARQMHPLLLAARKLLDTAGVQNQSGRTPAASPE